MKILWQSDERYMHAETTIDLLGDLVIIVSYGGRYNRRGQQRTIRVPNLPAAQQYLDSLHSVRIKHGYFLIPME